MNACSIPVRRRVAIWWLALPAIFCCHCSQKGTVQEHSVEVSRPRRGGTLVIGASSDIGGVNQLLSASDSFTQSVLDLMFLRLFQEQPDFDQHPPTFAPELASDWTWSEDHTELTLQLRRDVLWSNGDTVTAADVEWTWIAQTDPEVAWSFADAKRNITSVEALDNFTVRVVFAQPSDSQLANLNEGVILPKQAWGRLPFSQWRQSADWFVDHLVTNGPFALESWQRQGQLVLRRNERFFDVEYPYLDRLVFRIVPHKVNQVGQLLAGDLHFVDHVPPSEADRVAASSRARIISYWPRQYDFICWNTTRQPFDRTRIRQALTQAIDRQALVDALWFGHARISTSPIISTVWAHDSQIQPWPYDPATAAQILKEEGWSDSDGDGLLDRNGEPFSFELITNSNSTIRVDAAVLIQEQLRRVGIQVRVRREEFNTLTSRVLVHDFDAMLGGWSIDTTLDVDYAFHSDSIDGGYNFGSFFHPELDQLIEAAQVQVDNAARTETLHRIQRLLHEEQPYTFLWEPQRTTGVARGLRDAQPNALDPFFALERWWLDVEASSPL